ncbi:MAG: DUF1566 domain-containing protein [Bacteroidota bacterium]
MKATNFFLFIALSVGLLMTTQAQTEGVSINSDGSNPDPSAMLDVKSTTKGFLGPRMTTVQRNAISNPAKGLLVFDTDLDGFWYHDGMSWKSISSAETAHIISNQGLVLDSCVNIPIIDVSNQNGGGAFQTSMYWQGFQATRTANLIGVSTAIWSSIPLDGYFRIYEGEGVSGQLLYEVIIGGDNLAPFFFYDNPIPLQKDSIYTMQVEDTLNTVAWGFGGGDSYPPSTSSFGQDLNFTTYVDSCGSIQVLQVNDGSISLNQVDTIRFADGSVQTTAAVDTKLTEAEVDAFVSNNGYLTTELDDDPSNEIQTLSISGNSLSISGIGGNSVVLPTPDPSRIRDADGNTQIQTEESPNENAIRFDIDGTERLYLSDVTFTVNTPAGIGFPGGFGVNSTFVGTPGNSLYFGHNGVSEDFIGYSNNTFYFKDSPGGGDVSDPNISTNGTIFAGAFSGDGSALTGISVSELSDTDNDTRIQVEETTDEDTIRFDVTGVEFAKMDGKTLHIGPNNDEALFIGKNAGLNDDGQSRGNTFVGYHSGIANTSGGLNAGLGTFTLALNTTGQSNTALGREAMVANTSGSDNTAAGYVALRQNNFGDNNSAFGSQALVVNDNGSYNVGMGFAALSNNTSGNENTAYGSETMQTNTTGSRNTVIGFNANVSAGNLTNATAVGANAIVGKDSSVVLGNAANVGIGTSTPDAKLHVVGNVRIVDGNQGARKILVSDANGVASWQNNAVPDTALPVPIRFHGSELYVHPTENATDVDWTTAQSTCSGLTAFGFSDWYLPSRLELDAMYKQSYLITGLVDTAMVKYWSNTEQDTNNAYSQRLDYGGPDPDPKTDTTGHNCRCIRKDP